VEFSERGVVGVGDYAARVCGTPKYRRGEQSRHEQATEERRRAAIWHRYRRRIEGTE